MAFVRLNRFLKNKIIRVRDFVDSFLSFYRQRGFIKEVKRLRPAIKKNLLIFVHYDKHNILDDHVISLIMFYKRLYDADVVLSTNLPYSAINKKGIDEELYGFMQRKNAGLDFFAWKNAIFEFENDIDRVENLIIANDSVYGAINPGESISLPVNVEEPSVWGATDSYEKQYHLQSYLLIFNRATIKLPEFKSFWESVKCLSLKHRIVEFYEIGLSQYFIGAGVELIPFFDYREVRGCFNENDYQNYDGDLDYRVRPVNPTNYFAKVRVEEMGFPLLKVSYLWDNPYSEK